MESGQLESPNFPEDYQLNKECIWRIRDIPSISEFSEMSCIFPLLPSPRIIQLILLKFMNFKFSLPVSFSDIEVYTTLGCPRTFKLH